MESQTGKGKARQMTESRPGVTPVNPDEQTMAQFNADARLMAEFEESEMTGKSFDYTKSVPSASKTLSTHAQMTAYLTKIQRGGIVQSFGCVLVVEVSSFKIVGFSENCYEMLGLKDLEAMGLVGIDARFLFSPASKDSLEKAFGLREVSFLNPIWVISRGNNNGFYAILHRIDVGIVVDLEPIHSTDHDKIHAGALQSQKLAARVISRLQSLPGGNIGILCDALVEDVQQLGGFDRVMVYRFHEDNHGEVISEIRRKDLEAYRGVHYPATDVPQAARFLFKQNRVRMIYDCRSEPVKIIQSKELKQPICLVNSTLRAPHQCHREYMVNMGSIASLVMALVVNDGDDMKLWGLLVCHHTSPRYVPFPLRYAFEFMIQAFSLQLQMEIQIESQVKEKKLLHTQALLSDMLLRDAPLGIVTQSPNIMDLVMCDGAALYYDGKSWLLGVTPTATQLQMIVEWLLQTLGDSMGLSTDSLAESGFPGATLLGDAVCGMAVARITSSNFLFWFRSQTNLELKWGGFKNHEIKCDGKMNPRSSFSTFLEVIKSKSLPWETTEINAVHSLQLIMRNSLQEIKERGSKFGVSSERNDAEHDQLSSLAVELVRLIENATAPIFGVDSAGLINGWNTKMCELIGLDVLEALGKSLISHVVHEDSREVVELLLMRALQGKEDKNVEVKLVKFGVNAPNSIVYILTSSCTSRDYKNDIVGVCFVGQDVTAEKTLMNKFIRLQGDYKAIIQSANSLIPPIFASDENACCCEWNAVMENLTGWMRHEIIGKMLPGEIFGNICQLKDPDVLTKFMIVLYRVISGHDTEKLPFGFFNRKGEFVEVNLTASKRVDESGNVIGCLCFLQTTVIIEKESVVEKSKESEQLSISKEMAYIMQSIKNPMSGIRFTHQLLQDSVISDDQKKFLDTSDACERQILSIIDDGHLKGKTEIKVEEFVLGNVVNAVISQAMILLKQKSLHLIHEIPEQIKSMCVYGDQMKLQLALSDFLVSIVDYAPSPDGWVEIKVSQGLKLMQDGNEYVNLEFKMTHSGKGLPNPLIEDMFGVKNPWTTNEGIALNISQKLLSMMNGNVRYIREQNRCYFQIDIELMSKKSG